MATEVTFSSSYLPLYNGLANIQGQVRKLILVLPNFTNHSPPTLQKLRLLAVETPKI